MPRLSAVLAVIRDEGILNLPRVVFESLRLLDFHIYVINRGELLAPPPVPEGVIMYADALDRLKRARENRTDLPNEFWRDQTTGASQCATLELNGELGGVVWAYEYPAERPLIILEPGEAELSTSYTLEKFRGRGFYRALLYFATEWQLRERPRMFSIVASDNPTPKKAFDEIGLREVGVVRRRGIGGPKFSVSQMRVK
ncbi:MAG: GNAT family N-acetyltransferase [Candidatus Binatus sp.]|jgi:GNAT superfamily N-acetyltransferase